MIQHLLRSLIPLGVRISPRWVSSIRTFLIKANRLNKNGGYPFLVKYLKGCSVLVQQVAAGNRISDTGPLGCRISRTNFGYPRIIPKLDRKLIRQGDKKVIQVWLTFFSIFRDITFEGELKINSITAPSTASPRVSTLSKFIQPFISVFFKESDKVLDGSGLPFLILTSGPQSQRTRKE